MGEHEHRGGSKERSLPVSLEAPGFKTRKRGLCCLSLIYSLVIGGLWQLVLKVISPMHSLSGASCNVGQGVGGVTLQGPIL